MNHSAKTKSYGCKATLLFYILIISALPASTTWCFSDEECINCHSQSSKQNSKTIDAEGFLSSVHGEETSCAECHQDVTDETHTERQGTGVVDCGGCHEDMGQHGNDASIACYACHTRHNMYPASDIRSALHWQNLENTCGQCHSEQVERPKGFLYLTAWQITSHLKESFYNQYSKNMCIGCHQGAAAHGEVTQIDEDNCFKCHMEVGNYAGVLGHIHGSRSQTLTQKLSIICIHIIAASIVLVLFLFNVLNILSARFNVFKKKSDTWPTLPPL